MKRGIHIPKDKRLVMAARALEIRLASKSENAALAVIEDEFDVSNPTARNLVSYGKYLLERREGQYGKKQETLEGTSGQAIGPAILQNGPA